MDNWSKEVRRLMGCLMLVYRQMEKIEDRGTHNPQEVLLKESQLERLEKLKDKILVELKKIK